MPVLLAIVQRAPRIESRRRRATGIAVAGNERDRFSCLKRETYDGGNDLAAKLRRRAQNDHVGAGKRAESTVVKTVHPWDGGPIAESYDELAIDFDAS